MHEFDRLNKEGIAKMNADLEVENPDDAARRKRQQCVLGLDAELIQHVEDIDVQVGLRARVKARIGVLIR